MLTSRKITDVELFKTGHVHS